MRLTTRYVEMSEARLMAEFGVSIAAMMSRPARQKVYATLKEWLEHDDRPGEFCFGLVHRGSLRTRDPLDPLPHLRVYITDENVRFEFKMRWC